MGDACAGPYWSWYRGGRFCRNAMTPFRTCRGSSAQKKDEPPRRHEERHDAMDLKIIFTTLGVVALLVAS
jgi:hypothetical protein